MEYYNYKIIDSLGRESRIVGSFLEEKDGFVRVFIKKQKDMSGFQEPTKELAIFYKPSSVIIIDKD